MCHAVYVPCRVCVDSTIFIMYCMCHAGHERPATTRMRPTSMHVQTEHYQYLYSYCTDLPIDLPMAPSSHRTTHLVCVTTEKYRGRSRRRHDVAVSVSMRVIWEWTVFRRSRDRPYVCPNEPSCVTPVSTRVFYHPRRRPRIRGFHLFPFLIRG